MKAHRRRSQVEQQLGHPRLLLKTEINFRQRLRRQAAKARKFRAQPRQPPGFTLRILTAGAWQNRLTLNGRVVKRRVRLISVSACSTVDEPSPSEPSAPAPLTAAASSGVDTPAIGA